MSNRFAEYNTFDLSDINKKILQRWQEGNIFHQSLNIRKDAPSFVFYEGPPSANGMPGIHHVIARSIKDIFCRYKTMKGYRVDRKAGWDTHGLPVELGVEKELGVTKEDIGKKISVSDYNMACRKNVMKFTKEWEDLTQKMGYWVDMDHPYITYDNRYIETLWFLLKELHRKGLLYKGYTIQPYSPAAGTGLSSHELNQPGCYRDVKDTTVTAQFRANRYVREQRTRSASLRGRQLPGLCRRIRRCVSVKTSITPLFALLTRIPGRRASIFWQKLVWMLTLIRKRPNCHSANTNRVTS